MDLQWWCFADSYANASYRDAVLREYHIQAPDRDAATDMFQALTGWWPSETICPCCGPVFSVYELDQPTTNRADTIVVYWSDVVNAD